MYTNGEIVDGCEVRLADPTQTPDSLKDGVTLEVTKANNRIGNVSVGRFQVYWKKETHDDTFVMALNSNGSDIIQVEFGDTEIHLDFDGCTKSVGFSFENNNLISVVMGKVHDNFIVRIDNQTDILTCPWNFTTTVFNVSVDIQSKWPPILFSNLYLRLINGSSCLSPNASYQIMDPFSQNPQVEFAEHKKVEFICSDTALAPMLGASATCGKEVRGEWYPGFSINTCISRKSSGTSLKLLTYVGVAVGVFSFVVLLGMVIVKIRQKKRARYRCESKESHFIMEYKRHHKTKILATVFTKPKNISIQHIFPPELYGGEVHKNMNTSASTTLEKPGPPVQMELVVKNEAAESNIESNSSSFDKPNKDLLNCIKSKVYSVTDDKSSIEREPVKFAEERDYENNENGNDYSDAVYTTMESKTINEDFYMEMSQKNQHREYSDIVAERRVSTDGTEKLRPVGLQQKLDKSLKDPKH